VIEKSDRENQVLPAVTVQQQKKQLSGTVVDEAGQTAERQIKTGFTDGNSVEVLEGLGVNETVVVRKSR